MPPSVGERITLRSFTYDGRPHKHSAGTLVESSARGLVIAQPTDTEIWTPSGTFRSKGNGLVVFPPRAWFNVICFTNWDVSSVGWYCNVATPAYWVGDELQWADLDLDVIALPDGRLEILDKDEFATNLPLYPSSIADRARATVETIQQHFASRAFPFDTALLDLIDPSAR